jgi:hypothetical protein
MLRPALLAAICALAVARMAAAQARDSHPPCESSSQSAAVFVGVTGAPVKRWVRFPDHPPVDRMKRVGCENPITPQSVFVNHTTETIATVNTKVARS